MHTILLLAVLHSGVAIPPIRVFQPYPYVKCPRGYSVWWPDGKEFDNDKYAECVQTIPQQPFKTPPKTLKGVSLRHKKSHL